MTNILIVDEDQYYIDTVRLILKTSLENITIQSTTSSKKVVNICKNGDIDLLLMDLNMPEISGANIAKTLQKSDQTKDIPIVFVTSASYRDFEEKGFKVGGVDYISKPIEKNTLINRVGLYLTITEQNKLLKASNTQLKQKITNVEDQNKMQEQMLIHQSKTSVMGEMIGAIAHQWRQPLNVIATSMINLETKSELDILDKNEIKRINQKVSHTLQVLSKTIDNFRNFFLSSKNKENVDMVAVIDSTIELVKVQFASHNITINFEYDDSIRYIVFGYFSELRQVLLNLFANSKDALEERMKQNRDVDGYINITIEKNDDKVSIVVADNGGGISQDIIIKVFAPYFTTKFSNQGTGIGLYLSKTIIDKIHSGNLSVESRGETTSFKITLDAID